MATSLLLELNRFILLIDLLLLLLPGGWLTWLAVQHLRLRASGTAQEAALLASDLPPDAELPAILVQLPSYNEGTLPHHIAAAIGALDWPRDRLQVQFLDDSDQPDRVFADAAAATLRSRGIDTVFLRRPDRDGFKAGALAAGLRRSRHDYVAMFDVDFVPKPDFLRLCIRPLLADPRLAFVQARWSYLNAGENALTRAQQHLHDAHFAIEQTAKSWSGHLVTFNGSGGIWRRQAIDEAGGWQADTLTEDMDLSFRAQICGWRAMFLSSVTIGCELPGGLADWRRQQSRWNRGLGQVARKHLPSLWRSDLGLARKLAATLHLAAGSFGPLLLLALLCGMADLAFGSGPRLAFILLILAVTVFDISAALTVIVLGQRHLHRSPVRSALPRAICALVMLIYLHLASAGGVLAAWCGTQTDFIRTPKRGAACPGSGPSQAPASQK